MMRARAERLARATTPDADVGTEWDPSPDGLWTRK